MGFPDSFHFLHFDVVFFFLHLPLVYWILIPLPPVFLLGCSFFVLALNMGCGLGEESWWIHFETVHHCHDCSSPVDLSQSPQPTHSQSG